MFIGCDTGGTFTDFVMFCPSHPERGLETLKLSSTPDDPSRAVLQGVAQLCGQESPAYINHATTVATNALLEGQGGRVAFFVTEGFQDMLWLGRGNRLQLYALSPTKTQPPLKREDCHQISERIDALGRVLKKLKSEELPALSQDVSACAVCLLHSSLNPDHELQLKSRLQSQGMKVFCSSEIAPGPGEYERGMTTLIAAALSSKVEHYISQLSEGLGSSNLMIVHSAGGLLHTGEAKDNPHRLALSGPAAGLRGALGVGKQCGELNLVTLDMGGTSTDVALLDQGELPYHWESEVAGLSLRAPTLEIHTIGAGGGSLARADISGLLRVGPQSAGARPGPACYGRGGSEPTVTDALCHNGFLPSTLGDEEWPVRTELSRESLENLASKLALTAQETADGILELATEHLAGAVRKVTTARGHDPAAFTLFPFGGAGPLLACAVAEELQMTRILIPRCAGVLSAWGALTAPWEREWSKSLPKSERREDQTSQQFLGQLRTEAEHEVGSLQDIRWTELVACRYEGQGETLVCSPQDDFHELHASRFGFHRPGHAVEIVEVKLRATRQALQGQTESSCPPVSELESSPVRWRGCLYQVPRFRGFPSIPKEKPGPLLYFDQSSTLFVAPHWKARTIAGGHLLLTGEASS